MANSCATFTVRPTIFLRQTGDVVVTPVHEDHLSLTNLKAFLASVGDGMIGLAPTYDELERLNCIAFASQDRVLTVKFSPNCRFASQKRVMLQNLILLNTSYKKYAFRMDKLAASLFRDYSMRIKEAIDILSGSRQARHLLLTIVELLGGEWRVDRVSIQQLFRKEESSKGDRSISATQAWAAYQAALVQPIFAVPNVIDTTKFSSEELDFLSKTIRDAELLRGLKPAAVRNDIEGSFEISQDKLSVQSSRYKTRIMRPGSNQVLQVEMTRDGHMSTLNARLAHLKGRMAQLDISGAARAEKLSICTIGREDPTAAEALRTTILLKAIQNIDTFLTLPFVQDIWFPKPTTKSPYSIPLNSIKIAFDHRPLNGSQRTAVKAILSDEPSKRFVLIQGPPGTGKTTVIAAAVLSIMSSPGSDHNLWLVAQSNVAVKNIAEKLADVNFFDFKLLVSKDFHFDWHEHLYTKINDNVIRSDDFPDSTIAAERLLLGSKVILCTLSMLSNDRIAIFTRLVPPTLFIFDEASQIEVGDYVPMLHRYQNTTRKLVFIGDDKQLPPYGQSDIENLRSVFELPHLRRHALFLDTQYRMPVPIGTIVSHHVYNDRLKSVHRITTKTCCRFVDVPHGREEFRGRSWVNEEQAKVVVALARKFEVLRYSYRIITPYDGQRSLIENSLKAENVVWQDKVFNVDSFQGNEDDYIVISLVRTDRVGFLWELRRVNVMLTRCKKGMIICTDRGFVNAVASSSLVALLARAMGNDAWIPWRSVLQPYYRPFPVL
ncbi:hypothetical protein D9756_003107 [Leucocoprinus leucothites]|uniref:DNA2/NAM7 helicase-like C-terminal domain-containing protein n=1 Tax=Leucocoprinus leucothites TaxID=201217 RepID=A0A8H5G7B8_9AGAR|nr:hypothetical protein D9756_003107 [Leucoagaricus leucothites]